MTIGTAQSVPPGTSKSLGQDYRAGAAMKMQVRGWREERTVWTLDTMGQAVPVSTGLTKDRDGRLVAVIAIGDGPSAILHEPDSAALNDLQQNIAETLGCLDETRKSSR